MTFKEFKELALNPPYIEQKCVYRVDAYRIIKNTPDANDLVEHEVKLCQSFMYNDRSDVQFMLPRFIHKEYLNQNLYALYIYQCPVNKDVSNNLYQRLWVYDRKGNLNAQSMSSTLIEDLDKSFAKFRGRSAESIRFKPGDIVEVFDRERGVVKLAVIVKLPLTIEECWAERKLVEIACKSEGIGGDEHVDDNYWLYADADTYLVVDGPDFENNRSYPRTYDVFPLSPSLSPDLRQRFAEYHKKAIEAIDKIKEGNEKCMKRIHALVDLL